MKRLWFAVVGLLPLVGCQEPKNTKISADQVKKETREAAEAVAQYTRQQKDEYLAKMKEQLGKLDSQLDAWKEQAKQETGEARAMLDKHIQDLETKREAASKKLDDLKNDSRDAWNELKGGLDKAYDEFKAGLERAREQFK